MLLIWSGKTIEHEYIPIISLEATNAKGHFGYEIPITSHNIY